MDHKINQLKNGIWLYFILLIVEGALRKWIFPEIANALLLVRDPIALYLIYLCLFYDISFFNKYLIYVFAIVIICFFNTLFIGHGNFLVALFGARIFILHFPLIFIIGRVLNKEMVIALGKFILWLSIPMTVLIIVQFYSPQTAWVNRGIGGDIGGAGFSGANGYLRPPGTFSFISGTTSFYSLLGALVLYFWFEPGKVNNALLWLATISLIASIPFSISRTLFFQVAASFGFALLSYLVVKNRRLNVASFIIGISILFVFLSSLNLFSIGMDAFKTRFERANEAEGGIESVILDRYFGGLYSALANSGSQPIFGYGLGFGTNVGSMLIFQKRSFTISEGEWGRLIGELGPIFGIAIILIRVTMTVRLANRSWRSLMADDTLPWFLLSNVIFILPQGGWSQPASLGFCVFVSGILVASFKSSNSFQGKQKV